MADNQATAMLMEQWVRDNVKEIAFALSDIVPFICGECNLSDLKDRMNTVNVTFASVALNVIKQRNEKMPAFRMKISNDDDVDSI